MSPVKLVGYDLKGKKMFARMKLSTKLISGFGLVSVLLAVVVAFSWHGLSSVTAGYSSLLEDTVPITNEAYQVECSIL